MDNKLIQELLAGRKNKPSTGRGYAILRGGKRVPLKNLEVGHFEGRAGSIRRSRKGATRRLANGRRYYVTDRGAPKILAYKATP